MAAQKYSRVDLKNYPFWKTFLVTMCRFMEPEYFRDFTVIRLARCTVAKNLHWL